MSTERPVKHTPHWFVRGQWHNETTNKQNGTLQASVPWEPGPVAACGIMCAEACLASLLVMDSVRLPSLGPSPQSGLPNNPLPRKAALQIPHIRGIMSLCGIQTGAEARQWRVGDGVSVTISCMLICFSSSFTSPSSCLQGFAHNDNNNNSRGQHSICKHLKNKRLSVWNKCVREWLEGTEEAIAYAEYQ